MIPFSSTNVSAAIDSHTWDGEGANALASTKENWGTDIAPTTGDSLVFNAGSATCTFDLALALGSISITAGYSGTITQAATFQVTSYSQAGATWTGARWNKINCSGDFLVTGGTMTQGSLLLIMFGEGKTLTDASHFDSLEMYGNTTAGSDINVDAYFILHAGKTLTIGSHQLVDYSVATWSNDGTISGTGLFTVSLHYTSRSRAFGTIIGCPVLIQTEVGTDGNYVLTTTTDVSFPSTLSIASLDATHTVTFDLSTGNYALGATDITIGTRGILNGSASTITCSGNFDSSAGTLNANKSALVMNGATKTIKTANTNGVPYDLQISGTVSTLSSLNVSHNLTVDSSKTFTINSGNAFILGANGNASINGNVVCAGNWDSTNGTLIPGSSNIYTTGTGSFLKLNSTDQANNLVINGTSTRLITSSGRLANDMTVNSGGSVGLQNNTYLMDALVNNGVITQNGLRLNITGSSSTPLTGYGTFDGDLYLNGSAAVSYQVQTGLPMGNLYFDRDTKISLDSARYLEVVPASTEFVSVSIKSYGSEQGYAARWDATSTGPVTYSLVAWPNQLCEVWVDHTTRIGVVQTSSDGVVQFTYNGPFSSHEFTVSKSGGPPVNLQASFSYSIEGNIVSFTDKSYGGVTEHLWDFGDGTGSTAQSPSHKYTKAGEYVVSLTVYDSTGHSSTAKTVITLVLGPDFPVEPTPKGWNVWMSDKLTVSVSALALLIFGVWIFLAGYFRPLLPIMVPKTKKILGFIIILIALFWFVFVDNSHSWLGWGSA
jgi:PKD repeat protein